MVSYWCSNRSFMKQFALYSLLFLSQFASAQKLKKADKLVIADLQNHVQHINNEGVEKRDSYILSTFSQLGLSTPIGESFKQNFEIPEGLKVKPTSFFFVEGTELKLMEEYFPLPYSPDAAFEAYPALALKESGVPWFVEMSEILTKMKAAEETDIHKLIRSLAAQIKEKGATALILHGNVDNQQKWEFDIWNKSEKAVIPVLYINETAWKKYFSDSSASYELKLKVEIGPTARNAANLIGTIDNGSENLVIIDSKQPSGIASMLELAKMVKNSSKKNYNYAFVVYSNDGSNGANYFRNNCPVKANAEKKEINMDPADATTGNPDYIEMLQNIKKTAKTLETVKP